MIKKSQLPFRSWTDSIILNDPQAKNINPLIAINIAGKNIICSKPKPFLKTFSAVREIILRPKFMMKKTTSPTNMPIIKGTNLLVKLRCNWGKKTSGIIPTKKMRARKIRQRTRNCLQSFINSINILYYFSAKQKTRLLGARAKVREKMGNPP
jgi:hypothetical protein